MTKVSASIAFRPRILTWVLQDLYLIISLYEYWRHIIFISIPTKPLGSSYYWHYYDTFYHEPILHNLPIFLSFNLTVYNFFRNYFLYLRWTHQYTSWTLFCDTYICSVCNRESITTNLSITFRKVLTQLNKKNLCSSMPR